MKKSVVVLGGLMAISVASADISLVETAALVASKGNLGTRRALAVLVNQLPPEQESFRQQYEKYQPSIPHLDIQGFLIKTIADLIAQTSAGCSLQELSLLLKPNADQLEAGAEPVSWYVAAAKNYAYRDDARLTNYTDRLQGALDRYLEAGGNRSSIEAIDAEKAIDEIKNAAMLWQRFDDREKQLSQALADQQEEVLQEAIAAINDFVDKNKLVISTQYDPVTKLGVRPDQTTLRDRIQSILMLEQRAQDKLKELQEFPLPVCAPQEELTQAEQKLQDIINKTQQQNITSSSRRASKYIKELDGCITPLYNQLKDEKIKPKDSKLLLAAAQKVKNLGGTVTVLAEAEAALKAVTKQMQNQLKIIKNYEDAAVTLNPAAREEFRTSFAVTNGQSIIYLNAAEMNRALDSKVNELKNGLMKDFIKAAEYFFTLNGNDLQDVIAASLAQEEEGLLARWRKTVFGKTGEEQARAVLQSIISLDKRIELFKELIDLVPAAQQQLINVGVLNVQQDESNTKRRQDIMKIFASSRAVLDALGDFTDMNTAEKQALVDHALPVVWLEYKKAYQDEYKTAEESSLIKIARSIMANFVAATRGQYPIPQIR